MRERFSASELLILTALRKRGRATRSTLAAAANLSPAMAARLVARLELAGLIREVGPAAAKGPGRQALLFELDAGAGHVAAVDIGTNVVHVLVADLQGQPLTYHELPSAVFDGLAQDEIAAAIVRVIREAAAAGSGSLAGLLAVGLSVTGIIDSEGGVCVTRSYTPGWESFPLAEQVGAALDLPVVVEETARAKALAELWLGSGRGARHFLYVDVGTAIGAGIVIDGRPFRGISGLAGEFGHVTIDRGGALCRCGNRGCIMVTASARALVTRVRELLEHGVYSSLTGKGAALTIADVAAAAADGDKMALGLITEAGEQLGEAIAMALNLLGLDLVVVGGTLAHCSPLLVEVAARVVQLRVLPIIRRPRRVVASALGSDAAARGVALCAIDEVFAGLGDPARDLLLRRAPRASPARAPARQHDRPSARVAGAERHAGPLAATAAATTQ